MDIKKALGLAIRFYRTETIHQSQEKFALKIGMDRTYFASVESGKRNVSIENIKKIADGLDIEISDLLKKAEKNMGERNGY